MGTFWFVHSSQGMASAKAITTHAPAALDMDRAIFDYFETAGDVLRSQGISRARRKRVAKRLIAIFDDEHWAGKRDHKSEGLPPVDMHRPFGSGFNFNKAASREKIMNVELCGHSHPLLVNVSPLMIGHTV